MRWGDLKYILIKKGEYSEAPTKHNNKPGEIISNPRIILDTQRVKSGRIKVKSTADVQEQSKSSQK